MGSSTATSPVLQLQDVRFAWPKANGDCLDIPQLHIERHDTVFLHGPSGCGKSTLLSLLAGVLLPQAGRIALLGQDWRQLRPAARDQYRVDHVGYIFQQFNLLPYLSALENVALPCHFSARRRQAALHHAGSVPAAAQAWLSKMDLDARLWGQAAHQLSVGQQQRVAAARALIGSPDVVIADEPTSALDEPRRNAFLDVLLQACAQTQSALILVSHDPRMAPRFSRQLCLTSLNRAIPPAGALAL